ncbi:hypothetical protein POJ06DRAFT_261964 [Lipomyces tetrasporus]|uniref:La-domain-containing protein n=1 Tax=Lipomyces tetrasporus TaxID=54092 RepID=A0AAD7QM72_9ASCO|nr:uncharacterized protein POJ06DRAFT_261964 [Lipomyces tetrasporus]KAJ8097638.1 hypothetical protein POJ06DRAFT_261964 [Lipomyces tetrasporus]
MSAPEESTVPATEQVLEHVAESTGAAVEIEPVDASKETSADERVEDQSEPAVGNTEAAGKSAEAPESNDDKKDKHVKKRNIVSDASVLPPSSDTAAILKQVEFYFSDQNLPKDKFLWTTASANDGWVPISTIASFARMRRFQPLDAIVDALSQSKELLEVSEDREKVRRKIPLQPPAPEEKATAFMSSVYVKGFGEETPTSQFDLETFFEGFGFEVLQVRLRRDAEKKFKGSVFVEFASVDEAEKFIELDPKPKWNDAELEIMSKKAYVDMKATEGKTGPGKDKRSFDAFRQLNSRKRKAETEDDEVKPERKSVRGGRRGRGKRGRGRR